MRAFLIDDAEHGGYIP